MEFLLGFPRKERGPLTLSQFHHLDNPKLLIGVLLNVADHDSPRRYIFKVVLLGDYAVGKTCIVQRYISDTFDEDYKATLGVDICSQQLRFGKDEIQLQIWDLSGQTDFELLRTQYLNGSDCAVIVYDVTRPSSLENIQVWIREAHTQLPSLPIVLVGNKADLDEERRVSQKQAQQSANEHGMLFYLETSAKSGENVDRLFHQLAQRLIVNMNSS